MADTKTIMTDVEGRMQRAIDHLEEELNNVRAGKASPNVLNGVMVDYYGSMTPVSGVASVTVPDAKTILIQPWDKKMIKPIEKAIIDSNIGLTPSNNGEQILLSIPPLTEERRKLLVKQIRQEAEGRPAGPVPPEGAAGPLPHQRPDHQLQEGAEGGNARRRVERRRNAGTETVGEVLQNARRRTRPQGAGDHDGLMPPERTKRDAAVGSIPFRSQSDGADQPIR